MPFPGMGRPEVGARFASLFVVLWEEKSRN